jgi:hypothetical protein
LANRGALVAQSAVAIPRSMARAKPAPTGLSIRDARGIARRVDHLAALSARRGAHRRLMRTSP